jgi:hypothetical protein
MTDAKNETGTNLPMTFPKRMMVYVLVDLLVINLITYYFVYNVSLLFVISVSAIEIIALAVAFAFWVPRYNLTW